MAEETHEPSAEAADAQAALDEYKAECDKYVSQADKQLDQLTERHKLSGQEFDKQLVAIAGGGLALTITLTKDLLTKDDSGIVWLLYLSWLLFIVCLTVNLFSHRAASTHYNLMIDRLGHIRQATSKFEEPQADYVSELTRKIDILTPRINRINTTALVSCIGGVVLFLIFITTNRYLHNDQPGPGAAAAVNAAPPTRTNQGAGSDSVESEPATSPSTASADSVRSPTSASRPVGNASKRIDSTLSQHTQHGSNAKARP